MERARVTDPLWQMVAIALAAAAWSACKPADYFTWLFEIGPGAAALMILVVLRRRFRFSSLVYRVATIHFLVLAAGAHYTYEHEPVFDWLKSQLGLARNYSDRLGHFMQGFTPALVTREVLLRRSDVRGGLLVILAIAVPVAFSALYEIFEWLWVVCFYPNAGPAWLGMQGDPFDAQADMFMALVGAIVAVTLFRGWHDRSIATVQSRD